MKDTVGLAITVGVARTKFLAKVASGVAKPDGLLVVPADAELQFLHPLPVERIWGVGRVTAAKLHTLGLRTVGDVAGVDELSLITLFGQALGRRLHALAHNRDPRRVQTGKRRGSIGSQRAGRRPPGAWDAIDADLVALADRVTHRMRKAGRTGRTVVLRLRFEDFTRATRSHTLTSPTADTAVVLATARGFVASSIPLIEHRGLTLVGISVANLDGEDRQLVLPIDHRDDAALDAAVDAVRTRFGSRAVTRGVLVGRREHPSVPMLPD